MSVYELVAMADELSIFLGVVVASLAFMLPKGPRSAFGLLVLACGGSIVLASVVEAPGGGSYAKLWLYWAFGNG